MLSEIVKARNNITYYYASALKTAEERARQFDQRNLYDIKSKTIQNCIFGVDIEASAVDIAKLRLWLSLVVDEDLEATFEEMRWGEGRQKDPRPLPNLDYNIMCGNSLIDEFEGIQLFDDVILAGSSDTSGEQENMQFSLFVDSMQIYLDDLRHEQERLFNEQDQDTKREIKRNIDKIIDSIIRAKLERDGNTEGLRKYEESLKQKTKPYFLWKLEFARVFRENGGFDVVIGNPPWGAKIENNEKKLFKSLYQEIDSSTPNTFAYFLGWGVNNYLSFLTFVLPDSVLVKDFALTRKLIKDNVVEILWYENAGLTDDLKPFVNVDHDMCVLSISKLKTPELKYVLHKYEPETKKLVKNMLL